MLVLHHSLHSINSIRNRNNVLYKTHTLHTCIQTYTVYIIHTRIHTCIATAESQSVYTALSDSNNMNKHSQHVFIQFLTIDVKRPFAVSFTFYSISFCGFYLNVRHSSDDDAICLICIYIFESVLSFLIVYYQFYR